MKSCHLICLACIFAFPFRCLAEWKVHKNNDKSESLIVFSDGGSQAIEFSNNEDEIVLLILDRSFPEVLEDENGFPILKPLKPRDNGLLYWGEENFEKRKPIHRFDILIPQIERALMEHIGIDKTEDIDEDGYYGQFLIALERNKSNKTLHSTSGTAPRRQ